MYLEGGVGITTQRDVFDSLSDLESAKEEGTSTVSHHEAAVTLGNCPTWEPVLYPGSQLERIARVVEGALLRWRTCKSSSHLCVHVKCVPKKKRRTRAPPSTLCLMHNYDMEQAKDLAEN